MARARKKQSDEPQAVESAPPPLDMRGKPADNPIDRIQQSYAAAKHGRFRRTRTGILLQGSGADWHTAYETDWLRMLEYARDMDRNDAVVGQMVDRAVTNIIQNGFTVDPQTGDKGLDAELKARWASWADDPEHCTIDGQLSWTDVEELAMRAVFVDGDVFVLPLDTGQLQLIESHRCRTPGSVGDLNIVHGVEMNQARRRLNYHFTHDNIPPFAQIIQSNQATPYAAYDSNGEPRVLHIYAPKRFSQTRGVTAFAPMFDLMGMLEDVNFAKLVQQQVASCFAIFIEKDVSTNPAVGGGLRIGQRDQTNTRADGSVETVEGIAPGMLINGKPGEKLQGFSPAVPNAEYFDQVKLILQLVGCNLGLPLVMVLMDASETNFSGWRGAVDQAKLGFLNWQRRIKQRLHKPVYHWKVRQWASEDRAIGRQLVALGEGVYAHRWNSPRWPYVQPLQDAEADALRIRAGLTSPRRVLSERGQDIDDVRTELIEDNKASLLAAIEASSDIETATGVKVNPMHLLAIDPTQPLEGVGVGTHNEAGEEPDDKDVNSPDTEDPEHEDEEDVA